MEMTTFETARLRMREVEADDLDAVLTVYSSNADYLALTEGSGGEPGRYDRGMLERDFTIARMTPGRHLVGISLKESGELIGVLDWMEENPNDGKPWVGLLMIRADHQRQGLASEAFAGLAERLRAGGADVLRASVIKRNAAGQALSDRLELRPVATTSVRFAAEEDVVIVERDLSG